MASYFYSGTGITGTSTTAKVFKKSGVKNAVAGREYFNRKTGHVYRCTTGGKPDKAKWSYVRTDLVGAPNVAVAGLGAPVRGSNGSRTFTASWKVPDALKNAKNGRRAQSIYCTWYLGIAGKDPAESKRYGGTGATSSSENLSNFNAGKKTYTRADFYPGTTEKPSKLKLSYVSVTVQGKNDKGWGKPVHVQRDFSVPRKPSISAPTFDASNGTLSVVVRTDPGNDYRERYDTRYRVTVTDTSTGRTWKHINDSGTGTERTIGYDAANYALLNPDTQHIRVQFEAWARGYAGDSEVAKKVYYISFPAIPTISGQPVCSSLDSTGVCTVKINTNQKKIEAGKKNAGEIPHPVHGVRLLYLADVEYARAVDIPGNAGWESTEITDDAECKALAISIADLVPSPGRYTWVRIKSWAWSESRLYRYSKPVRVKALETPAATATGDIAILSIAPGADGESAVVQLGWNANGQDNNTGTELSWSDAQDTWKSTKNPSTYEFEWSDGSYTHEGTTYLGSANITIKGLDDGETTYVRARRYLEGSEKTTFTRYSNTVSVIPTSTPDAVALTIPPFIASGTSLGASWTYGGNGRQRSWQLIDSNDVIIDEGDDALGSHQIPFSRLGPYLVNNAITLRVRVSTGGEFVTSEPKVLEIAEPPTLSVTAGQITSQPATFTAECDADAQLLVTVTSQGTHSQSPAGIRRQADGDCVHTGVYSPTWTNGETTVTLPEGLDFIDKGGYTLSVIAVDPRSQLESEAATDTYTVAWAHQAPVPEFTVEGNDVTDEDNTHHLKAVLTLALPTGAAESDSYDIYRLTGDGAELIGAGFALTGTFIDEYAPFGDRMDLRYRVACRTADGDEEFLDAEYELDSAFMRIDWEGNYVELPYNIQIGDAYRKDVDTRKHLDGSTEAYWNKGITRTTRLSTDIIRLDSQELVSDMRALARYEGAAFVRTPDGSAYTADVQVTDMSTTGVLEAVSIDCTEIGLLPAFMLPRPNEHPVEAAEENEE